MGVRSGVERHVNFLQCILSGLVLLSVGMGRMSAEEPADWYYRSGPLAGSLKSDRPLPLYDPDAGHLWNRVFALFYIRPSELTSRADYPDDTTRLDEYDRELRAGTLPAGPVVKRFEGGDTMSLLAWPRTRYYSEPQMCDRANKLLDEFIETHGERLIDDPLKRAFLQRDLWAVFDHLVGQNIARLGDVDIARRRRGIADYGIEESDLENRDAGVMQRRETLCRKLAVIIRRLALPRSAIKSLPDTYAVAIGCGRFAPRHDFKVEPDYLPPGLLTVPGEWVEIDTSSESMHRYREEGQIDYVAWSIRGRSYYRIFWRFPGGRPAVEAYLRYLRDEGVDWPQTALQGYMALKPEVKQIPVGTETAIVQFMIVLDEDLIPVPTRVVESVRVTVYKNVDGSPDPETNTGRGLIGRVYGARRHLLFDDLKQGGLERVPDHASTYTVLLSGEKDWGIWGRRQSVVQSCLHCHMYWKEKTGVFSLNSITCFAPGVAMPGVAMPMGSGKIPTQPRGPRIARWKLRLEDYLRLVEYARPATTFRQGLKNEQAH